MPDVPHVLTSRRLLSQSHSLFKLEPHFDVLLSLLLVCMSQCELFHVVSCCFINSTIILLVLGPFLCGPAFSVAGRFFWRSQTLRSRMSSWQHVCPYWFLTEPSWPRFSRCSCACAESWRCACSVVSCFWGCETGYRCVRVSEATALRHAETE